MKRFLTRASVAGLSAALVAGVALVAAPAASAAQIGTLTATGLTSQAVPFTVTTSGACPATATNFQIRVFNDPSVVGNTANLLNPPSSPNIMGNTGGGTIAGGINTGPFTATLPMTLQTFAGNNGLSQLGQGTYIFELFCRTNLASASLGEFQGRLVVGAAGAITSFSPVLQNVSTTTVVTPSAASIDTLGSATFSATVSPAAGSTIAGSVQFKVGGVNFGAPVAVNASGVAVSGAYSSATTGNKAVTADFLGGSDANNNYGASSGSTSITVTQATGTTVVNLGLSAATVAYPSTVTATATVTGAGNPLGSGTVQFKVDGAAFGAPVAVNAAGIAVSAPIARTAGGPYVVTAEYSGATIAGVAYPAQTSPSASFDVTAPAYAPDVQNITTSIAPGTITISTPYTAVAPLVLAPMTLNTTATEYSTSAAFQNIVVTDTRPGNDPWTVSAIASDLTKFGVASPTVNETIDAQNVGLTGLTLTSTNSTPNTFGTVTFPAGALALPTNFTGFNNPAAAHVTAGSGGSAGLGASPKPVVHANAGLGTSEFAGTLTITAPTNTRDGVYNGIITFTVIGS